MDRDVVPGDGLAAVAAAMQRVLQMQEERARRIKAVAGQHHKAVAELRTRTMAQYREELTQREQQRALQVARVMSSVERRKALEAQMQELALRMNVEMGKVEEMMLAGYRGREMEATSSMEAR